MKAGVVYPQIELGGDTGAVKAFAEAAEELGYDHIVIYDHVLGAVHAGREPKLTGPYKETDPFHEPLVTYAYLAGITKKLELVTGVIILPQRQTALFAKQAANVDLFSCFQAGLKPRRSKSRRGSWPSCASSEGMPMHSASSRSSNTAAGTTSGLAILRRGARLGGATYLS